MDTTSDCMFSVFYSFQCQVLENWSSCHVPCWIWDLPSPHIFNAARLCKWLQYSYVRCVLRNTECSKEHDKETTFLQPLQGSHCEPWEVYGLVFLCLSLVLPKGSICVKMLGGSELWEGASVSISCVLPEQPYLSEHCAKVFC